MHGHGGAKCWYLLVMLLQHDKQALTDCKLMTSLDVHDIA